MISNINFRTMSSKIMWSQQRTRVRTTAFISLISFLASLERGFMIGTACHRSSGTEGTFFMTQTHLLLSKDNMISSSKLPLQQSVFQNLILIRTLPLIGLFLLSLMQQGRPFSFMILGAQEKPIFTILSATICAHKTRLSFVLRPLALLLFFSWVAAQLILASRSLFPAMRQPFAPSPKTLNWQS